MSICIYCLDKVVQRSFGNGYLKPSIIGSSENTKRLKGLISSMAASDASVLVTGESGCGKELVAQAIHEASERRYKPFVAINCGAIPSDLLESQLFGHKKGAFTGAISDYQGKLQDASTGTLFLDEIGDMPMNMQVKLLRVLQERQVTPIGSSQLIDIDIRVVAATHRNLEEEISNGRFRSDLYYRLNVLPIQVSPLRERPSEIKQLIEHFASLHSEAASPVSFSEGLLAALKNYDWPGNVRELSNTVHRLSVLYPGQLLSLDNVDETMLPAGIANALDSRSLQAPSEEQDFFDSITELEANRAIKEPDEDTTTSTNDDGEFESIIMLAQGFESFRQRGQPLKKVLSDIEQDLISRALKESGGNVSKCAKLLSMQRTTLIERIKKYELDVA